MKPIMPLILAILASCPVFAQTSRPADPFSGGAVSKGAALSHEDSVVLAEVTDSLTRADSLLHARIRVLSFPAAINAVLKDFPYNLRNITGELVLAQGEFENYASIVELPGAENCIVTRYHSADDTTASWQAKMLSSDDFDEASKAYHALFRKLQGCYLQLVDGSVVYLKGEWEPVKDGASFTTSTLRLMTGDWRYKDVKVELELVYQLADWAIHINIVTKKRDDEVGGRSITESP
ncbi:MAG TPA: hypothetical protein VGN00_01590 [Puia sp.]|jgi:hypothetical protein